MSPAKKHIPLLLVLACASLLLIWLELTPQGLLGKLDAVGFAVCHQITERSFFLAERQLPLCARCSGMYLGTWVGLIYLFSKGRAGGLPIRSALIPLAALAVLFVVDGVNSYLTLFNPHPILYVPQNWLRMLTGSGLGIGIAAFLVPTFNLTVWLDVQLEPIMKSWKPIFGLLAAALLANLGMLSNNPLLVYPLALLSSITVMILLTLAYTLVWVLLTHRENTFRDWKQASWHILAGFGAALLQIGLIDFVRYTLTGSWAGF